MQVCLTVQPWRMFLYGYLSDCRRFEVFKATRLSNGNIAFERSGLCTDANGWNHLNWLLMQTLDVLGFEDITIDGWVVDKYLGKDAHAPI